MTETLVPTGRTDAVTIRSYRPTDHRACRQLWAEFTAEYRELYPDRAYHTVEGREEDLGAGFEEYLTRLDLSGMWVASVEPVGVVGLVGLLLNGGTGGSALFSAGTVGSGGSGGSAVLDGSTGPSGSAGEVEPVVVTASRRGQGIGRALLRYVAEQARHRGLRQLTVSPASRNVDAIRSLHAAGYESLSRVTLAIELSPDGPHWQDGIDLHELRFRY